MISQRVIDEIYKRYGKRKDPVDDSRIDYFINLLSDHHDISKDDMEIIVNSMEPGNFFRRFLKRNIRAILEFDNEVAFVFPSHILFLSRTTPNAQIHMRLDDEPPTFWQRLFGRKRK